MNKRWKIKLSFLFGIIFFQGPLRTPPGPFGLPLFRRFWTSHYIAYKQDSKYDNSEMYEKYHRCQIILVFQSALFICKKSFEQWTNDENKNFHFYLESSFFKDPEGVQRGGSKGQSFRRFWTSHYTAYKQDYEYDNSELYQKYHRCQIILVFQSALFICKKSFEQWTNDEK